MNTSPLLNGIPHIDLYALFAAVSRCLPEFHQTQAVRLALIRGRHIGSGLLQLLPACGSNSPAHQPYWQSP